MRINKIAIICFAITIVTMNLYGQPCHAQNRKGIDIYFQNLTYIHSISDIPYREFLNDKRSLRVVHIENSDTLNIIRNRVDQIKNRYTGKKYDPCYIHDSHYIDTYIALIDHARQDTISLNRHPISNMMHNDKVIQPDSSFSSFIYHLIDERDPGFILVSFPDNDYEELQRRLFD